MTEREIIARLEGMEWSRGIDSLIEDIRAGLPVCSVIGCIAPDRIAHDSHDLTLQVCGETATHTVDGQPRCEKHLPVIIPIP